MYRKQHNGQLSIEEFVLPFGGKLDPENRWVLLSDLIPWEEIEDAYAPHFSATSGAPAKSGRVAFGALYIKQRLGLTDEETVMQIQENAYMQYFLGFSGYISNPPFDPSMMVHFRKRFPDDVLRRTNELIVERGKEMLLKTAISDVDDPDDNESSDKDDDAGLQLSLDSLIKPADWPEGKNWGTLSIDASCTPADIAYPTDIRLVNEARETTERIIDDLCKQRPILNRMKPHYDRKKARSYYLEIAKKKKPRWRKIQAAIRRQLSYVQRNLEAIDSLIASGTSLHGLRRHWQRKLLACSELYRQQQILINSSSRSIADRIVHLVQTHVRPIVRGKARAQVEFGAKISISIENGFPFLHRISWNAYSEAGDLAGQAEAYKQKYGCYPERICADQLYMNAQNRKFCTRNHIRLSGKPLGRPRKDTELRAAQKEVLKADQRRRNEVEGAFGTGKRKYSLDRIMAKLIECSESMISMAFVVMCAEKILRLLRLFFVLLFGWIMALIPPLKLQGDT